MYALITGSCGGIGEVVAMDLAKQGYKLILLDINTIANSELVQRIQQHYPDSIACCITLDLTDRDAVNKFCQELQQIPLTLAFINAGTTQTGRVIEQSAEQIDMQLEVNLRSSIMLNRACVQSMQQHDTPCHIINTVSLGAMVALEGTAIYSATKAGLRSFLTALKAELSGTHIAISGIYPAAVDTPMLRYEARNNGNVLNFLSSPSTPQDILQAFHTLQKTKKLEIYVPYSDSLLARLVCMFPTLLHKLSPMLETKGIKGQQKYLQNLADKGL